MGAECGAADRVWDGTCTYARPRERRMYARCTNADVRQSLGSYRTPLNLRLALYRQARRLTCQCRGSRNFDDLFVPGTREIPREQVLCLALCPGGFSLCVPVSLPANANPELSSATQGAQSHDRVG